MSKKATRRAVRQGFPKAKNPTTGTRGIYGTNAKPRGQRPTRPVARQQTVRPPSPKRALVWGGCMAVIYFVLIQWGWKSGGSTLANLLVSIGAFILFAGVVYGVDRFKYQRYLRKQKQSPK